MQLDIIWKDVSAHKNVSFVQVLISARDRDSVPKSSTATATLSVSVYRNTYAPQFQNVASYATVINEDISVPSVVTRVTATDADKPVCMGFCVMCECMLFSWLKYS